MENYKCQRPIHPGELLKEEVENRKLPQTKGRNTYNDTRSINKKKNERKKKETPCGIS